MVEVNKNEGQPFYSKQLQQSEVEANQTFVNITDRLVEVIDITVPDSLKDLFGALDIIDVGLQQQINDILDGTTQFTNINLPVGFTHPEAAIVFDGAGHSHTGGAGGAEIDHASIISIGVDDHHAPESGESATHTHDLAAQNNSTSDFQSSSQVNTAVANHAVLPNAHHDEVHTLDSHTGALDDASVAVEDPNINGGTATTAHTAFAEIALNLTAHTGATGNVHGLTLLDIGAAAAADLTTHLADADGHSQVPTNTGNIIALQADAADLQTGTGIPDGTSAPDYTGTTYLTGAVTLVAADIALDIQIAANASGLAGKVNTVDLDSLIDAYSGNLPSINDLTAATINTPDLTATTAGIGTLTATAATIDDLVINNTVSFPEGSIEQTDVASSPQDNTWHASPAHLQEELNNIRNVLKLVSGEPTFDNSFSATSKFGGQGLKAHEEQQWYYDWFVASTLTLALIFDTFKDSDGLSSGSAIDHEIGPGSFVTTTYSYNGTSLYDADYFVLHVEASDLSQVTVNVSLDNGSSWRTCTLAGNDFDAPIWSAGEGKQVILDFSISSGVVYSYGILLGRSDRV